MKSPIHHILFDLDGTLLDTAPDLATTLNTLRQTQGYPPLPLTDIRPKISQGIKAMLALGFAVTPEDSRYRSLSEQFLQIYVEHIADETQLFPGMRNVLNYLQQQKMRWGIVTNKSSSLTHILLEKLDLAKEASCIVSGDTLAVAKPHPEPLWHACHLLNSAPEYCLYVGDTEYDIIAGQRAGMRTIIARYGYLAEEDEPSTWQADAAIDHPEELLRLIDYGGQQ